MLPTPALLDAASVDDNGSLAELTQFVYLMPTGVVKFDTSGEVQMVNPKAVQLLAGCEHQLLHADALLGALSLELRNRWHESGECLGSVGDPVRVAIGDEPATTVLQLRLVRPDASCCMLTIEDVSEVVAQQRRIVEQGTQLGAVIEHMHGYAVMSLTSDGRIAEWNASMERQLQLSGDAVGQSLDQLALWRVPASVASSSASSEPMDFGQLSDAVHREGWHRFDRHIWLPVRGECWVDCVLAPIVQAHGRTTGYVLVVRDDTEGHLRTESLHRAAYTDTLTELPNRRALLAHVAKLLSRAEGIGFGAVLVDIDHFKRVNDTYGHDAGDEVLRRVAAALRAGVRSHDFVARLGGEEFVVVLDRLESDRAFEVVERLRLGLLSADIRAPEAPACVSASFGVAVRDGSETWDSLLKRADEAVYAAKAAGRNRVHLAIVGQGDPP